MLTRGSVAVLALACAAAAACASDGDDDGGAMEGCRADRDCPSSAPDCRQGRCRPRAASDGGVGGDGRTFSGSDGGGGGGECTPLNCEEIGVECGTVHDGCFGYRFCGDCALPETCGGGGTPNFCGCVPDCAGAACGGDDGCGGFCGEDCCVGYNAACDPVGGPPCCAPYTCRYYSSTYGYLCY